MEKPNPDIHEIIDDVKSYIDTSLELYKLKATEKGATLAAETIIHVVVGVIVAMILLFFSLALAYFLSEIFGSMYAGFLTVGGIYLLMALVIIFAKERGLKKRVVDGIIKSVYSHPS